MTLFTEFFPQQSHLLKRSVFKASGATTVTAPAGSKIIRASAIGAGGYYTGTNLQQYGGGAAFARMTTTCSAAEVFNVQVGNVLNTNGDGSALGDSFLQRASNSATILLADRGRTNLGTGEGSSSGGVGAKGLAANCIGDIKRDGVAGTSTSGGASGTDATDTYGFGIGGAQGANIAEQSSGQMAFHGGGGMSHRFITTDGTGTAIYTHAYAGGGIVIVEFFDADPGYGL
jgi:hypothetical protein